MTETTPEPFPIVDGAFTVPGKDGDGEPAAYYDSTVKLDSDGDIDCRDCDWVSASDIPAFIASLCALTGYDPVKEARRKALEEAARYHDVNAGACRAAFEHDLKTFPEGADMRARHYKREVFHTEAAAAIRALAEKDAP